MIDYINVTKENQFSVHKLLHAKGYKWLNGNPLVKRGIPFTSLHHVPYVIYLRPEGCTISDLSYSGRLGGGYREIKAMSLEVRN